MNEEVDVVNCKLNQMQGHADTADRNSKRKLPFKDSKNIRAFFVADQAGNTGKTVFDHDIAEDQPEDYHNDVQDSLPLSRQHTGEQRHADQAALLTRADRGAEHREENEDVREEE